MEIMSSSFYKREGRITRFTTALSVAIGLSCCVPIAESLADTPEVLSTPQDDVATSVSISGAAVYVAGYTFGSLGGPNAGGADAFVRRYTPNGTLVWQRQFGTTSEDIATEIAADASGNLYVTGYTQGAIVANKGDYDAFLRKYDPNGNVLWTRQFGTPGVDIAFGIAVDGTGDVYVTGYTDGALRGTPKGGFDVFIRKINASGVHAWTRQFGTAAEDVGVSTAVDQNGNVFIAGYTFGPLAGPNRGSGDSFLRKYDTNGSPQWTRQFGTRKNDNAWGVTTDSTGAVIVVGQTRGSATALPGTGRGQAYVRKYNGAGLLVANDEFGSTTDDKGHAVAVDSTNNFYVTGFTYGDLAGPNAGGSDVFVRKYNSNNSVAWTRQFGTNLDDAGMGIATLTFRKIFVAGHLRHPLQGTTQGEQDAFLRRLNANGAEVWTDE
jgi:hypothetical protein